MENVMIDLETLGTRPGCTILSIGAVGFSPESSVLHSAPFYSVISRASCKNAGLHEDPQTVAWWSRQSEQARQVLNEANEWAGEKPENSDTSLFRVLWRFDRWLSQFNLSDVKIWGNGSDFDNAILAAAYAALGMEQPWPFWNNRCHRTLKSLCPQVDIRRGTGTHHNALDDASAQADQAIRCLRVLRGWTPPVASCNR